MQRRLAAVLATDMAGYSRLMEQDESGTIIRQKAHRQDLIDPEIGRYGGNIVKATGDGLLAEFASAQDAVKSAVQIQNRMMQCESQICEKTRIQYRVGINVGDVVYDDGDIFGDGVNVASRLEGLAEPGGVCVSDTVYQLVQDRLEMPFRDLGSQRVKNISRPIRVWQWTPNEPPRETKVTETGLNQRVQFCIAPDGTQIAYAAVGEGFPILKAPNYLNHIEYEWRHPIWGPAFEALAQRYQLVRFDQRGGGLSDWDVDELSENAMVSDMETVAKAVQLGDHALLGISQGCSFSIRYAIEHREKVRCLILMGGYARGRKHRNSELALNHQEAGRMMIRAGWGSPNPIYRQFFALNFIPDATPDQAAQFDELQRLSCSAENAERIWDIVGDVDVVDLAKEISVPTLVLHSAGDRVVPIEEGRRMAALIPGARFVTLEGDHHIVPGGTPAFDEFCREIGDFIREVSC